MSSSYHLIIDLCNPSLSKASLSSFFRLGEFRGSAFSVACPPTCAAVLGPRAGGGRRRAQVRSCHGARYALGRPSDESCGCATATYSCNRHGALPCPVRRSRCLVWAVPPVKRPRLHTPFQAVWGATTRGRAITITETPARLVIHQNAKFLLQCFMSRALPTS